MTGHHLHKLLLAIKDYIEQTEMSLRLDDPWSLAYMIENGDMPTVYYDLLEALSDLGHRPQELPLKQLLEYDEHAP